ncbi:hypothetical protein TNCV_3711141 [Trichonephila clavipes]|uniref:DDE-1 domain-containing protein n=1 Tax=Trichonephila clavipes TaxID=2585209 RepID=A0A8X6RHT3_TRICX|nr:hypothetical protein TNCV_3711141 [Trichonephila clavipes]
MYAIYIQRLNGEKHSNERLTVLLAVDMNGSEKISPLALIKINKAWRAVTPLRILNCFKKSGLVDVHDTLMEWNTGLTLWEALLVQDLMSDDYSQVDADIAV